MKKMIDSLTNGIQPLLFVASEGLVVPGGPGGAAPTGETTGTTAPPAAYPGTAAPAQEAGGMSMWMMLIIWGVVILGFWLLMMRPQRKREKKLKELQAGIKAGDNVVTNSGLFGRVADVGTDCFVVEMGISGRTVKVPILKSDVLGVREPVLTPPPKESA